MSKQKIYRIKKLIPGYRIDAALADQELVAVPEKFIEGGGSVVAFDGKFMRLPKEPEAKSQWFKDHYGREDHYRLFYFEWKPGNF